MEDKELIIIALAAVGLLSLVIVGAAVLLVSTYPEILAGAGSQKTKMLVIGSASQEVIDILNDNRDIIDYRLLTTQALEANPSAELAQYDIVMLDQSEEASKEASRKLGEAVQNFVKGGGKFILVLDSGIRRPDTSDVIGWKNTFGDVVPAECDRVINNQSTCTNRIIVRGKIYAEKADHPIMEGIPQFPADPSTVATFETFDVAVDGKEIAYIQSAGVDKKSYPAIVEKPLLKGKVIYFNYNPGVTRGIFESTLNYLGG